MVNLYFDISAVIIIALLIFTTVYRGLTRGLVNRCFVWMLLVCFLSSVADVASVYFDNIGCTIMPVRYLSHYLYLMFHITSTPLYVIYLLLITDSEHKLSILPRILFSIPYGIVAILLTLNFYNHQMFYIDENSAYVRGPLFFSLYVITCFYVGYLIVYLIKYGKSLGARRLFGIASILPFLTIAMILQYLLPGHLLEMFAASISFLLMSSLIHRPEDIIDIETGLNNKQAFVDKITRCISTGKPTRLIAVKITNYDSLAYFIGFQDVPKVMHKLSLGIFNKLGPQKYIAESFYLGNGKFCFLMNYKKLEHIAVAAEEIHQFLQQPVDFKDLDIILNSITCLISCPDDIADASSVINFLDKINDSHDNGHVRIASELYQKRHYDIMNNIDSIIENALANHNLQVYYQPIYCVKEKRFNSAEALIRLQDAQYGFISPEFFIPAAEESGAIHRIGSFVLNEVCKFIASDDFKKTKLEYIEVNLSATQCMRDDLADELSNLLIKYDVKPEQINLEITETASALSQRTMMENINSLHQSGISFSLDDFGTGYSNIGRIASLPLKIVKLDKSFVNECSSGTKSVILAHTIEMLRDLNMEIVVEGIETAEMLEKFVRLGCHHIQGYYFSKPIPRDDFISFVMNYKKI